MIHASCLCGGVGWRFDAALEAMSHCHCSMCRKSHGSAFATWALGAPGSFAWLAGEELVTHFQAGPGSPRAFCSRCGSSLPKRLDGDRVATPAGNLLEDPGIRPLAHGFTASKAPWHRIADALPQFDTLPPGHVAPELERPRPSPNTGGWSGSCLCGDFAFSFSGRPRGIVKCHCSRCRRSRSAAHATNLFVLDAEFELPSGPAPTGSFQVPDSGFRSRFCRRCGSLVPSGRARGGQAMVPAGCIDGGDDLEEAIHIWVGSKAPWYEIADELRRFDGRPVDPLR